MARAMSIGSPALPGITLLRPRHSDWPGKRKAGSGWHLSHWLKREYKLPDETPGSQIPVRLRGRKQEDRMKATLDGENKNAPA